MKLFLTKEKEKEKYEYESMRCLKEKKERNKKI